MREQVAHFHLDEVEKFRIIHHVDLVQENDDRRHTDLAGEQNVLTGLRHRAVGSANHQDRAVHLRGAGDHVLHVVSVAGAIDVRVVALVALIFHVRRVDGDPRSFSSGALSIDSYARTSAMPFLASTAGDRRREGGFAMVNVADRADVHVRLVAFKCFLCHFDSPV